jgi:hypothetical protein
MTNRGSSVQTLLPPDALAGVRIAISASESADLGRLGLVETHFRLALGEIARSVLVGDGKLGYGGHLNPAGYTTFLVQELQRYSRRDRPLRIYLALQEHRKLSLDDLSKQKIELGLFGEIVCLDADGAPVEWDAKRERPPEPINDEGIRRRSLTALRRYMATDSNGRVLIGGKREGFQGELPGLVEESLISLEHGQPLYLVGGFGGVTTDIIRALNVDDGAWLPGQPNAAPPDERLVAGLAQLSDFATRKAWNGLNNGLSADENRQLAATPRPSEIAALVSLGLGRRFTK